jgi:hypothetical protein
MPEINTNNDSVTDLRRDLVKAAIHWSAVSKRAFEAAERNRDDSHARETGGAAMMASSYAYVLAAILKVAYQELADDAAPLLASEAQMLLDNGDFGNLNADVMPAAEVKSGA